MSSDRRILYTKKIIKESFLKLLNQYSIDEMTVKMLCLEADINRATFYRYYKDLYDLFKAIELELVGEISPQTIKDLTDIKTLTIIYDNQSFYREFFRKNLSCSTIKDSSHYIRLVELEKVKTQEDFNEKKFKYTFNYFIYGTEGLIKEWVENGCKETPKKFAEILLEVAKY